MVYYLYVLSCLGDNIYIKFGSNPDTGLFSYLKLIIFTPDYAGSITLRTYNYIPNYDYYDYPPTYYYLRSKCLFYCFPDSIAVYLLY